MKKIFMYDTEGLYVVPSSSAFLIISFAVASASAVMLFLTLPTGIGFIGMYSYLLVGALSPLIKYCDDDVIKDLINDVSEFGIEWTKEPVKVSFYISKSTDKDEECPLSLQLRVYKQSGVVSCSNYFESLSEALECISNFRQTFMVTADVQLNMSLTFGRHYKPEVPDKYKTMFDEINYPYAE